VTIIHGAAHDICSLQRAPAHVLAVVYFGPIDGGLAFAQEACPNLKEMEKGYNDAEFLVDFVTGVCAHAAAPVCALSVRRSATSVSCAC